MNIKHDLSATHLGPRLIIDGKPFVGGICLHDTAGSGTHNDTLYLRNPGDGRVVSVDFTVERDGAIYQLNPDIVNRCTWHAGRSTQWKARGRIFRNRAVTQCLVGIELVQKSNMSLVPIWPDEQVRAVAELCVYLCEKFNLGKDQITTHSQIITDGSRTDPRQFPFANFWNQFNGNAANVSTTALNAPIVYTVKAGDSLWKIANAYNTTVEQLKAYNNMATASNLITPGQSLIVKPGSSGF